MCVCMLCMLCIYVYNILCVGGGRDQSSITTCTSIASGYQGRGGRSRGPPRGGRQQAQRGGPTFRYDSEFDFESANARFNKEVLEEEFKQKLNMDEVSSTHSRRTSDGMGGAESTTSDDVIVEDVAGGVDNVEDGGPGTEADYYDKSKSFFDNISCEGSTPGGSK